MVKVKVKGNPEDENIHKQYERFGERERGKEREREREREKVREGYTHSHLIDSLK